MVVDAKDFKTMGKKYEEDNDNYSWYCFQLKF